MPAHVHDRNQALLIPSILVNSIIVILLTTPLSGCMLSPELQHADTKVPPTQEKADIDFIDKKINVFLRIEIDDQTLDSSVARLNPGNHKVAVTNFVRGVIGGVMSLAFKVTAVPCGVGAISLQTPLAYPLAAGVVACPVAKALEPNANSKCNAIGWEMTTAPAKKYEISIDWGADPPLAVMKNITDDNIYNIQASCSISTDSDTEASSSTVPAIPGH